MLDIKRIFPDRKLTYSQLVEKYAKGRFIDVFDRPVHYIKTGSGPPLIFLHGFLLHTITWHRNIDALAEHFTVYAVDLPGFGYSRKMEINGALDFREFDRIVIAFMDALNIRRTSLVAHSMSGGLAIRVAALYSERIDRIVLSAPHAMRYESKKVDQGLFDFLLGNDFITGPPAIREMLALFMFPNFQNVSEAYASEVFRPFCVDEQVEVIKAGIKSALNPPFVEEESLALAGLGKPVLLVRGSRDGIIPFAAHKAFVDLSPHFRLEMIESAGHTPHEECPEVFNPLALEFLH